MTYYSRADRERMARAVAEGDRQRRAAAVRERWACAGVWLCAALAGAMLGMGL